MAQHEVTPTTILPRHRSLTRQQVRADDKRTVALQLTAHDPNCLLGLPRELRDEIFWLAAQADADPARDAELVSRPSPTIRALTQVSRNVRAEVANIYWSRTKFHYSAHNLLRNKVHSNHCGHCRLRSWLSIWGKLAVPLVRRLDLTLSFHSGGLDMQLRDHTRPSFDVWIGNGFGAEESLKAYVTAALFPDDRPTMTTESLGIACKVLYEVGSIVSNAQGYFLENGCVDRAERMEQKRAEVAELLNMDRMVSWHVHTLLI